MIRAIDSECRCHLAGIPFLAHDARGCCMPYTIHLAAILVSYESIWFLDHSALYLALWTLLQEAKAISLTDAHKALLNYQDASHGA